ncbi:hypothetical protein GOBAR_AA37889 [Gossypium barbadense]|uniref:DNA-directed RNA polymerase II subunit RPB9-like zinc ribbon domain-containing protein n=1 Tax=Gossypium barbadense TaxID=3634 RepID=A0A2P5VVH1_GOSBA|nr:hypothetical protein GOBAR_AA37889 [Gossypium barbadense]
MEFCPSCGNMLQYELPHMGRPSRFFCPTCPYVCHLENKVKIKRRQHLVKKEIEPVFNKEDMKMGGSETDVESCKAEPQSSFMCSNSRG